MEHLQRNTQCYAVASLDSSDYVSGQRMSNAFDPGPVLDIDTFIEWLRTATKLPRSIAMEDSLSELTNCDIFAHFRLVEAFDELTSSVAEPDPNFYLCESVRDFYLHYLYVLSKPLEAP